MFRSQYNTEQQNFTVSGRAGPAEGEGLGGLQPHPTFLKIIELLRKKCFQPPQFESLVSPHTFKVAPQALYGPLNYLGLIVNE